MRILRGAVTSLQQQRADYEYRLAEQAQRLKAAEERARLEAETRKGTSWVRG
jgi:hypothetical protein